jgi:hypothetical protein
MQWRVGLAQFLGIVAILAVGLAVMKVANGVADRVAVMGCCVSLLVGTTGAIIRRRRSAWVGFALFGWAYFLVLLAVPLLALLGPPFSSEIPVIWPVFEIEELAAWMHPLPIRPVYPLPFPVTLDPSGEPFHEIVPDGKAPLTTSERKLWEVFQAQSNAYQGRAEAFFHSIRIALAFQGLAFALCGSLAGRLLDDRSGSADPPLAPTPASSG